MEIKFVWIFHGVNGKFSSGVFTSKDVAEKWVKLYNLTGILTLYPLDKGVYDWAIENDFYKSKTEGLETPEFIQKFTTASQEHYHYLNGNLDD